MNGKDVAPCSVCRFNKEGFCEFQGEPCEEVDVCGFAPQALKDHLGGLCTDSVPSPEQLTTL